jgi:hypothetical protein
LFRLGGNAQGDLTVSGNYIQSGGTFRLSRQATRTVTVLGDFLLSGGTLQTIGGGYTGYTITLNVAGDFRHTGGTLTQATAGNTSTVVFNGTAAQTYVSGGIVSGVVSFNVASGAAVMMGTSLLGNGSSGTFTLSSGGTLGIGDPAGISASGASGNIRVSGTRSYSTGGRYLYNGAAAQHTGNGLPSTVGALTIDNAAGVTLDATTTVSGALTLGSGKLLTGGNTIALGTAGVTAGASESSYVNGNVQKAYAIGSGQAFAFPVGHDSGYAPVVMTNVNVTVAGTVKIRVTAGDQPLVAAAGIDPNFSVNHYWTLTPGGSFAATYGAQFRYSAAAIDAGASASSFLARRYSGSSWYPVTLSGTPTTTRTTVSGLTGFGDFAIGDPTGYQFIAFPAPGDRTYGAAPIALNATASSLLPVSYTLLGGPATLSSNVLTITGVGAARVVASQAGDAIWSPAASVTRTVNVARATLTVTADSRSRMEGSPNPPLTVTYAGFVNDETLPTSGVTGAPDLSTAATPSNPPGDYPILVAAGDLSAANYAFALSNGTLTVIDDGWEGAFGVEDIYPTNTLDIALRVDSYDGRTYVIIGADGSPTNTWSPLYSVTNPPDPFDFVDVGAVSNVDFRFYRVVQIEAGVALTNPTLYAAYVRPLESNAWHKLSMPIDLSVSGTLNGRLGDQMKRGLSGHNVNGDLLYVLGDDGNWSTFKLDGGRVWTKDDVPADDAVQTGVGYWVRRRSSGPADHAVYTGPVITSAPSVAFRSNDWHIIAWPFPTPRSEAAGERKGWGFAADGAKKSGSWMSADLLQVGQGANMEFLFLNTDGRWYRPGATSPATDATLQAGEGYYYYHRGTGFVWRAEQD